MSESPIKLTDPNWGNKSQAPRVPKYRPAGHAFQKWTGPDIAVLQAVMAAGLAPEIIASSLGRSVRAVLDQIEHIEKAGGPNYTPNSRHGLTTAFFHPRDLAAILLKRKIPLAEIATTTGLTVQEIRLIDVSLQLENGASSEAIVAYLADTSLAEPEVEPEETTP